MSKARICLGYVHGGEVRHEFLRSVLETINVQDWQMVINDVESGPLLSKARNMLFKNCLTADWDYLLSVDTDVMWKPSDVDQLLQLAKRGKDIVGGHYWAFNNRAGYMSTGLLRTSDGNLLTLTEIPHEGYKQVDALGMGFTMIRRKVIETLDPDPLKLYPFAEQLVDGIPYGEDVTFCLRAAEKGFDSWLTFDTQVAHVKSVALLGP